MVASIGCSFSGTVLLLQNHYPRFRGAPSGHFRMLTKRPPSVDSGLGIAGGLGALARYGLNNWVQRTLDLGFPWGLLVTNSIGCFVFGLVWSLEEQRGHCDRSALPGIGHSGRLFTGVPSHRGRYLSGRRQSGGSPGETGRDTGTT